ncbi:MAG: BON domain-containing protein [Gemmatimonadetes bacterium]|nr:BON domain-containing protein [Gemmatimonadota bacterium]
MARVFGDIHKVEDMSDDELEQLIRQQLQEYPNLDVGWIEVNVRDGVVTLTGSVGTDSEKQVAEKVVAEVVGVKDFSNQMVVSKLHRGELPESIDESLAEETEMDDHLGGNLRNQSDTAAHLIDDPEQEAFGTRDMQQAIQEGITYIPPDRPIADGYGSEEQH